ncbi:MAG: hypothetical protein U0271_14720 [Polyangiaceae bacterium]
MTFSPVAPEVDNHWSDPDKFADHPPELWIGINRLNVLPDRFDPATKPGKNVPPGEGGADPILGAQGANYVKEIVEHILGGLSDTELANAWQTDAGKEAKFDPDNADEEEWARRTSEMFFQNCYGGPDFTAAFPDYAFPKIGSYTRLIHIYQRLQLEYWTPEFYDPKQKATAELKKNSDPAYSLVTACQQLSTYSLVSRGFTIEEHMNGVGVTAGSNKTCEMFSAAKGGRWVEPTTSACEEVSANYAIETLAITPGSVYCYDPNYVVQDGSWAAGVATAFRKMEKKVQASGSHIWPVLRIEPASSGKQRRYQNFEGDYSGPTSPHYGANKAKLPISFSDAVDGIGRFESTWLAGATSTNFCGLGVAPVATRLKEALAMLSRARPVGLARLVIIKRSQYGDISDRDIVFVSRFARMWGNDETENYPPARFLLSLRNTPYFEDLQAFWFIYAPTGALATVMWREGARSQSVSDLFVDAMKVLASGNPKAQKNHLRLTLANPPTSDRGGCNTNDAYACVMILTHDSSGIAKTFWRYNGLGRAVVTSPQALAFNFVIPMPGPYYEPDALGRLKGVRWDAQYLHPKIVEAGGSVEFKEFFETADAVFEPPSAAAPTPTPPA